MFYHGGPINHCTHVPDPVSQSSYESEYNAACTAWMDLSHFRILKNELIKKYPFVVPEQTPITILYSK